MQDYNIDNPLETVVNYTQFVAVKLNEHSQAVQDKDAQEVYSIFTRIYAGIGLILSADLDDIKALDNFVKSHVLENNLIEKAIFTLVKKGDTLPS